MVGRKSDATVYSADDLRKLLKWPDAPVVEYPNSDGKAFLDVNGGVFITLPCPLSEVHERIAESVLAQLRGRAPQPAAKVLAYRRSGR